MWLAALHVFRRQPDREPLQQLIASQHVSQVVARRRRGHTTWQTAAVDIVQQLEQPGHRCQVVIDQRFEYLPGFPHQLLDGFLDTRNALQLRKSLFGTQAQHRVAAFVGHLAAPPLHQLLAGKFENVLGIQHQAIEVEDHSADRWCHVCLLLAFRNPGGCRPR